MLRFVLSICAVALAALPVCAEPLIFSATGCGPYTPQEEPLLAKYVDLVGNDGKSEFLIHLGDIVTGKKKDWPESQYEKVASLLKPCKVPVFIVPGDNEWNDLNNPNLGWKHWSKHFLNFEKNFANSPKLEHPEDRPENFAWLRKGVLVIGINLVGGRVHDPKEWRTRHEQNNEWIKEQMTKHGDKARAMVVLAQAEPVKNHDTFFSPFVEKVKAWGKPTLYLHADGHVWQVHPKWRAPNLLRVQTDMIGNGPPVLVTVTDDDTAATFVFDRRLKMK